MNEEKMLIESQVEFVDSELQEGNAEASIGLNPAFKFLKFVLTDSKPNLNKQRIPVKEFDNLIRTGQLTPIKMGKGKVEQGHENAFPIGVISHLKKTEDDKIVGLAAIWSKENPDEYNYIKENFDKQTPLNISWEILYRNSTVDADGISDLEDTVLKAAVLVGRPAYGGRTQVLSVASEVTEENMELKELEEKVASLETELSTKITELETKNSEIETLKSELTKVSEDTKDYLELKEFKASVLKEKEEDAQFEGIKTRFSEAGITKDETYFKDNKAKLLSMPLETLDFMMQELVAFKNTSASIREKVPNLDSAKDKLTPRELGEALRNMKK